MKKAKVKIKKRKKYMTYKRRVAREKLKHDKKLEAYKKASKAYRSYLVRTEKKRPLTAREQFHKDANKHSFPDTLSERHQKFIDMHEKFKLQFELVPGPQSFINIRNHIGDKGWNTIRFSAYKKADNKCEICGGIGKKHPVECHEVWSYDLDTLLQKLEYFQALCPYCHGVKHIGMSEKLGYFELSMKRFCDINGVDMQTALDVLEAVRKQWSIRNDYKWTMDVNHISQYGMDPALFKIDEKKMEIFNLKSQIAAIEKILERKKDDPQWMEILKNAREKLHTLQPKSINPQLQLS